MISMAEHRKRREAVQQSIASARLEGAEISGFTKDLLDQWTHGEIEIEEIIQRILAHYIGESPSPASESPHHS